MLAILLISAKYKRVFSSAKHLITNSCNCLKADIIKANKCLKLWFGCLEPRAFNKGNNSNINKQEGEEEEEEEEVVEEAYKGVDKSLDKDNN